MTGFAQRAPIRFVIEQRPIAFVRNDVIDFPCLDGPPDCLTFDAKRIFTQEMNAPFSPLAIVIDISPMPP
jgi:hypothetical protein